MFRLPQDSASRRRLARVAWPATILIVLAGLSLLFIASPFSSAGSARPVAAATPPSAKAIPVEAATVERSAAVRELTAVGTMQSNESVVITAEIAGRVAEIAFAEGEKVPAGKVLLRLDPSVLAAERDRAQANLGLSEANYHRAELLLKENAIAQRERDEAYAQWKLDEATLRLAEAQLEKTVIRAPFSGFVGLRRVSIGSYLRPGDIIANLEQIDPVKVDFRLPETYAGEVKVGQEIRLSLDAVPGRTFGGKVYAIDPQIEASGRSVLVRARVANADGPLRPGMFARIALVLERRAEALMIPEESLVPQREGGQAVYRIVAGKVEPAPVRIGLRDKGRVEIVEGLSAGDTVVTAGHLKVRPGMSVTVLPSSAEPIATAKGN